MLLIVDFTVSNAVTQNIGPSLKWSPRTNYFIKIGPPDQLCQENMVPLLRKVQQETSDSTNLVPILVSRFLKVYGTKMQV